MTNRGLVGIGVLGCVLWGTALEAQDFDRYREFALGSDVADVSAAAGTATSDLKVIHQRPALIQELTWRPRYGARRQAAPAVERIVFAFHEGRLFRMTIEYDPGQTEGLSDADIIEAVSAIYGSPLPPAAIRRSPEASVYGDPGTLIAQWGNVEHSVKVYRVFSYATRFRMVVTAEPIAAVARTAAARAVVLDDREAPQLEAARAKKEADDRRAAEEKARSTNKATFRP